MIRVFIPAFDYKSHLLFEIFEGTSGQKPKVSGIASGYFTEVADLRDADWILVPIFITSLTSEAGRAFLKRASDLATSSSKPLGLFSNSDLIANPGVEQVVIFTPGAYRSLPNLIDIPALLPYDPIAKWFGGEWSPNLDIHPPSIGFCGQATLHPLKALKDWWKIESLRRQKRDGKSPFLHIPRFLPAWERGLLLKSLARSKSIKTDFILRSKYKGGANTPEQKEEVEKDFYQNISHNLFTVCLRGLGNYSVRFFQTLAMGRIPILIDTDSDVPFLKFIDGGDFFVRVPYSERANTDQYIREFVQGKSNEELIAFQKRGREIWTEYYQSSGMIRYVHDEMLRILDAENRRKGLSQLANN